MPKGKAYGQQKSRSKSGMTEKEMREEKKKMEREMKKRKMM